MIIRMFRDRTSKWDRDMKAVRLGNEACHVLQIDDVRRKGGGVATYRLPRSPSVRCYLIDRWINLPKGCAHLVAWSVSSPKYNLRMSTGAGTERICPVKPREILSGRLTPETSL